MMLNQGKEQRMEERKKDVVREDKMNCGSIDEKKNGRREVQRRETELKDTEARKEKRKKNSKSRKENVTYFGNQNRKTTEIK